jgi:hypothetical protein
MRMLTAIQLDDQFPFKADEIDDEFINWLLPPEFDTLYLPGTELIPQYRLNTR